MEIKTQIEFSLTEVPDRREKVVPIQELAANFVTYRFERLMGDILTELSTDDSYIIAAPVNIP